MIDEPDESAEPIEPVESESVEVPPPLAPPRLFAGIEQFGDRPAIMRRFGRTMTFAELAAAADAWAASLGPEPGLLAMEAANEFSCIVALVGACRAGCPVLLLGEGRLTEEPRLREAFQPDFEYRRVGGEWTLLARERGEGEPVAACHPELAVLLTTSGSAGDPKLVRLSAANLIANARAIIDYLGITAADRAITSLPLNYSYGLSVVTSHLLAGASLALSSRGVHDAGYWTEFEAMRATSFAGVPLMYEAMERAGFLERKVSGLRTLTQAGGRLDAQRVQRFARHARGHGAKFFVMYGQTEAAPRMAWLPPELAESHPDCIGVPVPGGRLWLVNGVGEPVETPDTPGELCYAGPNVMLGYAFGRADLMRGPELTVLRTGDVAERTVDGLFRIVGRSSRFVKVAGLRISLDGLESDLAREGVGARVAGSDERIVVAVTSGPLPAGWRERWVKRLGVPLRAFNVLMMAAVPTLDSGKPDYATILRAGREADPLLRAGVTLRTELAAILGGREIADDESFNAAGGDSLNFVEGALAVERCHGRRIPGWETLPMGELCRIDPEEDVLGGSYDPLVSVRAAAIGLTMVAHVVFKFELWRELAWALVPTAMATPLLLVVFGLVLARKFGGQPEGKSWRHVIGRCWPLAITFYLAVIITVVTQFITSEATFDESWRVLVFNHYGQYAGIWMDYTWMALAAPLLVVPIERWRGAAVALLLLVPWLAWPWLDTMEPLGYFWGFLMGVGGITGPSVLHGSTFVVFGYLLGLGRERRGYWWVIGALAAGALTLLVAHVINSSYMWVWLGIAFQDYRGHSDPVYMAFGMLGALAVLGLTRVAMRWPRRLAVRDLFLSFGRNSLFTYLFGNVILCFTPDLELGLGGGVLFGAVFISVLALISDDVGRWKPRLLGPISRGLRRVNLWMLNLGRPRWR